MGDTSQRGKPRPVAFMVMPFRERKVPSPPRGAPATIDCDALWDKAFRPTLLGAAFRSQDVLKVKQLAVEVARQGAAAWKLESTLDDIADTIEGVADESIQTALSNVCDQLKKIAQKG